MDGVVVTSIEFIHHKSLKMEGYTWVAQSLCCY